MTERFGVTAEGRACTPAKDGDFTIEQRDGVPYALLVLDYRCPGAGEAHELRSGLFPDSEGYVRDTKTIVTYDLDLKSGSAALDAQHPRSPRSSRCSRSTGSSSASAPSTSSAGSTTSCSCWR